MEYSIIIVVCLIFGFYFIFKKKDVKTREIRYDLIVRFDSEFYINIRQIDEFKEIASWRKYGTYGFRGFSKLNKEDLKQYILDTLKIPEDKFDVSKANIGLYLPN